MSLANFKPKKNSFGIARFPCDSKAFLFNLLLILSHNLTSQMWTAIVPCNNRSKFFVYSLLCELRYFLLNSTDLRMLSSTDITISRQPPSFSSTQLTSVGVSYWCLLCVVAKQPANIADDNYRHTTSQISTSYIFIKLVAQLPSLVHNRPVTRTRARCW